MNQQVDTWLRGDFHVHSQFSDDATSTMEENLAAAAAVGLAEIRLIDHVRQSTTWVPEYLRAIAALPRVEGLTVYTGVEAKILNAAGELDIPSDLVVGEGGIDAIVIADHQFPGPEGTWHPDHAKAQLAGGLAVSDALDLLIGGLVGAMERAPGSQLAHCFSILPKIGLSEDDLSDEHLAVWAATAARTGTSIEANEKWGCPEPRSLRAALGAGAVIVASTDSHVAAEVGRYDRVASLLAEAIR